MRQPREVHIADHWCLNVSVEGHRNDILLLVWSIYVQNLGEIQGQAMHNF